MGKTSRLKAIETEYNGYKFRSRREARWAVFFDFMGIDYLYEEQGFDLNGTYYLPDFWLPEFEAWLEVKGTKPSYEDQEKAALLAQQGIAPVFIFWSNFDAITDGNSIAFWKDENGVFHSEGHWRFNEWYDFLNHCSHIRIVNEKYTKWFEGDILLPFSVTVENGMRAARQARFEHGEQGKWTTDQQSSTSYRTSQLRTIPT